MNTLTMIGRGITHPSILVNEQEMLWQSPTTPSKHVLPGLVDTLTHQEVSINNDHTFSFATRDLAVEIQLDTQWSQGVYWSGC